MKQFNVINFDFNAQQFKAYDVIPYFIDAYKERIEKYGEIFQESIQAKNKKEADEYKGALEYWKIPKTFEEFKDFVKKESQYQFWSRCEYEIILVDWPCQKIEDKWDVHDQIMMNLDIVTEILMKCVEKSM